MFQTLNLPDWLPWWVPLALLVPASLWALSFLFMPFSVFGLKSRLEVIEGRLEEIQNDLRHMAGRFPAGGGLIRDYEEVFPPRLQEPRADRMTTRPPIPLAGMISRATPNPERTGRSGQRPFPWNASRPNATRSPTANRRVSRRSKTAATLAQCPPGAPQRARCPHSTGRAQTGLAPLGRAHER